MVHRDIGQVVRDRDPLGELAADDQPADQSGTGTRRDTAKVAEAESGARHDAADLLGQECQMRAGGDLRHHAAIGRVLALLAQHRLRQHAAMLVEHRRRRLVARGLDAQHRVHCRELIFPVARESNRTPP